MSNIQIKKSKVADAVASGGFKSEWARLIAAIGLELERKDNATVFSEIKHSEAIEAVDLTKNLLIDKYPIVEGAAKEKMQDHSLVLELLGPRPAKKGGNNV
jgi:hypothetical protein